jgi:LysR family hydrogen peroxide-inducible transcriptional activator
VNSRTSHPSNSLQAWVTSLAAMDLRQLGALTAIADHGGFSAAARALHTVQSNVSTHVARLERELGVVLVDRSTGALTEEGEAVVGRARRVQAELDALVADVASVNREVSGSARIGIIGTTARWLTSCLLEAMAEAHPRVDVVVVDATTTSLLPQLDSSRLDLAVIALPVHDGDIETETLFEEDLIVVAPPGHPLYDTKQVTLHDLAQHDVIVEPPGTAFRDDLEKQAKALGVTLRTKAEVDGMRLVASLAFEGFGAAVLPASAVPRWYPGDFARVTIEGVVGRTVGLAFRRRGQLSAPARALREVLREVVAEQAPLQPGISIPAAS